MPLLFLNFYKATILELLKSYASQQDIKKTAFEFALEFTNQERPTKIRRLVGKSCWLARQFYIVFETRLTLSIFTSYMEVVQVNLSKNDCFLQLGNCYYL